MIVSANMSLVEWVNINCIYFISTIMLEIIFPYMFLQSVSKVTAKEREGKRREGEGRRGEEKRGGERRGEEGRMSISMFLAFLSSPSPRGSSFCLHGFSPSSVL